MRQVFGRLGSAAPTAKFLVDLSGVTHYIDPYLLRSKLRKIARGFSNRLPVAGGTRFEQSLYAMQLGIDDCFHSSAVGGKTDMELGQVRQ